MTQRPQDGRIHLPLLLVLVGYAMAGLQLWPSVHVALSNASVFVDYVTDGNGTEQDLTISLVDMESNSTLLTRHIPYNKSKGSMEFDCSCFLYAGSFRFRMGPSGDPSAANASATLWWSPVLHVSWPTFHIAVERASNDTSSSFQIGVSTNDHFHGCTVEGASRLLLEVTYLEHNQIGKSTINKIRAQTEHEITSLRSQRVELGCVFPFTEHDFIKVALKSPHLPDAEIKTSMPLYLSRIFPYKLLVDSSSHRAGCKKALTVRLVPPPCAFTNGKVLLYRDTVPRLSSKPSGSGTDEATPPAHLAYRWLTQGENETEFNCSIFDPGKNKYCFRFILNFSRSTSPAQTCTVVQRTAETWGPWQPWSGCSVSCGEGVRERTRTCLVPSGGGMQCTGLVKEQSHCSLEDCIVPEPLPSLLPPPKSDSSLRDNLVGLVGISLCLAVIVATIVITVWRKVCRAAKCSSVRRSSMPSPSGRKNSDEASICGHSLQRPSFCDSLHANAATSTQGLQKGQAHAMGTLCSASAKPVPGQQQEQHSMVLTVSPGQDPDRLSPSGQKIVPPIFGYKLAQQQLKEMKKQGLREATKVYHVSQSPIDDTLLEAVLESDPSAVGITATTQDSDSQTESNLSRFQIKSPFLERPWKPRASRTLPDRLGSKSDYGSGSPSSGFTAQKMERTADWVEMVERCGVGYSKNPAVRRTASFHETKLHKQQAASVASAAACAVRSFRERSMTQVSPRQIPDGSCRTRGVWEQPVSAHEREHEAWSPSKPPFEPTMDSRRRPWIEVPPRFIDLKSNPLGVTKTASAGTDTSNRPATSPNKRFGGDASSPPKLEVSRAEQNWNRRGPSPIQRNILARKLREANSNASPTSNMNSSGVCHRQRSATFSSAAPHQKDRSLNPPLSGDYGIITGSPYGLSAAEQRMIDLPGHLDEVPEVQAVPLGAYRRT